MVYQLKFYCDNRYIGLTTRQEKKRVKKLIPVFNDNILNFTEKEKKSLINYKCNKKICYGTTFDEQS